MLWPTALQNDLTSQPATFQNKEGGCGKLTNILAQQPGRRFRGKNRDTKTSSQTKTSRQFTLNLALPVEGEDVLLQAQEEILCFPGGQGRIDFQTGNGGSLAGCYTDSGKFLLQQRFGVTERP